MPPNRIHNVHVQATSGAPGLARLARLAPEPSRDVLSTASPASAR